VNATNPQTRKRPLRDIKPPRCNAYFKPEVIKAFPQYELLITAVRKTLFGAHLPAWWTRAYDEHGNPQVSHLMNDLIDTGVSQSSHLLQRGLTHNEKAFLQSTGDWQDDYNALVPLPDEAVVKGARSVAGRLARDQMIIRRPPKVNPDGTPVLDDKGKPKRGYESEIRASHPRQDRDDDGFLQSWTSPLKNHATTATGTVISNQRTPNGQPNTAELARNATNEMVNQFDREMFVAVLQEFIGDNAQWLLTYYDDLGSGTPKTDKERQRAYYLMTKLKERKDELQKYFDALT